MILSKRVILGLVAVIGCICMSASAFAVEVTVTQKGVDAVGNTVPSIPLVFKSKDKLSMVVPTGVTATLKSTNMNRESIFNVDFMLGTSGTLKGVCTDQYGFINSASKRITSIGSSQIIEIERMFNKLTINKTAGVPADTNGIVYLSTKISLGGIGLTFDSSEKLPWAANAVHYVPAYTNTPTKPLALYVKSGSTYKRIPIDLISKFRGEFTYTIDTDTLAMTIK